MHELKNLPAEIAEVIKSAKMSSAHDHLNELPPAVKKHLGLDEERSWIVVDELNTFTWPGYDLRPIKKKEDRFDYGFLLPKLFG